VEPIGRAEREQGKEENGEARCEDSGQVAVQPLPQNLTASPSRATELWIGTLKRVAF
jgi:hypothetical protein